MAKKLGKRAGKKGFDTRDYLVIGGYVIFALWLVYLATTGREKNRLIKRQCVRALHDDAPGAKLGDRQAGSIGWPITIGKIHRAAAEGFALRLDAQNLGRDAA